MPPGAHHNYVIIDPMNMKFGAIMKVEVFYTMVVKISDVSAITQL